MADEAFKPGDLVYLKSGGPTMTIWHVEEGVCKCQWFDMNQTLTYADFYDDVLVRQ